MDITSLASLGTCGMKECKGYHLRVRQSPFSSRWRGCVRAWNRATVGRKCRPKQSLSFLSLALALALVVLTTHPSPVYLRIAQLSLTGTFSWGRGSGVGKRASNPPTNVHRGGSRETRDRGPFTNTAGHSGHVQMDCRYVANFLPLKASYVAGPGQLK